MQSEMSRRKNVCIIHFALNNESKIKVHINFKNLSLYLLQSNQMVCKKITKRSFNLNKILHFEFSRRFVRHYKHYWNTFIPSFRFLQQMDQKLWCRDRKTDRRTDGQSQRAFHKGSFFYFLYGTLTKKNNSLAPMKYNTKKNKKQN